ncbi:MAG: hypothetical protein AAB557_04510 [Patescibacteria group bacterium]
MKYVKILFLLVAVLILFSFKSPLVAAQEKLITPDTFMPPIPQDSPNLGQDHAYSVLLRGNGDAVVTMRAAFTNEEPTPTNIFSLRIPRVEPKRVSAFQISREPQCLRFKPYNPSDLSGQPNQCQEYQDANYFQWYGQAKYQKATTQFTGDTLTITLPKPVLPAKSGSVLVVLMASGYAKKDPFGAYSYAFETFQVEKSSITKSTIGISVDSDLVLDGAKGTVNYRFSETEALSLAAGAEKEAMVSPQLDQLYSQTGYGTITKTASYLEPLESYTVKGRYADSLIRLYGKGILIGLGIFAAVLVLLFFLGRSALRALTNPRINGATPSSVDVMLMIGGSFLSAGLIAVYTAGLFFLRTTIQQVVSYELVGVVLILATIISIGLYGLLLIAPAILVGLRRGLAWGMGTFGLTILFLIINTFIMILTLTLLYGNAGGPMYPMMRSSGSAVNNRIDSIQETPPSGESSLPLKSPK